MSWVAVTLNDLNDFSTLNFLELAIIAINPVEVQPFVNRRNRF